MKSLRITLLLLICILNFNFALSHEIKSVYATKISVPITIDGLLKEETWNLATPAVNFIQRDPLEGEPASEPTEIKILYDDKALYFGCMMFDSEPDKIVARLTRRDIEVESDVISIRIDSYHDHQTAFEFTVNAAGVKIDILQFDDGAREDESWNAVWDVETRILNNGWSAEFKIPFSVLRYKANPEEENIWGINFIRAISRKNERAFWAPIKKSEAGFVSRFGHLLGLDSLPSVKRLEVLPFVTAEQRFEPAKEFMDRKKDFSNSLGADIRFGISSNFTLEATVNPDFGQVEVDPAVLNLTTFETFFPEKRPFFMEGMQILSFSTFGGRFGQRFGQRIGAGLFYTRRIGKAISLRYIDVPENGKIISAPSNVTILGAAKLTGKTQNGLSVGVLEAVTANEYAYVADSLNNVSKQLIEPLAHYNVVRLKQDFESNSNVGFIVTSVTKKYRNPVFTSGTDWNIKFDDNTYMLDGFLAGSLGRKSDKRIDGTAGRVNFSKIAGEHWLWNAGADFTSNNYNINDIGFFMRPGDYGFMANVTYKNEKPTDWYREFRTSIFAREMRNTDGWNLGRDVRIAYFTVFNNYWMARVSANADFGMYDDRETRRNGLYRKPRNYGFESFIRSDDRENIVFDIHYDYNFDSKSKRRHNIGVEIDLKPTTWTEIGLEVSYEPIRNQEAWVMNIENNDTVTSIFGDRDTDKLDFTLRNTLTFTRDITLQLFGQLLLAKGNYRNFRKLVTPSHFETYQGKVNNNFNEQFFNLNLVFRWEFLPGSIAYLVWTHNKTGESLNYFTDTMTDFRDTFRYPPSNVFLLKISYWWSL